MAAEKSPLRSKSLKNGDNMIKIDLITGFLGSGKTTFLLKYARYLMQKGLKIGILEYDYGAVNIDMMLLSELRGEKCEVEMLAAACDSDCLQRRFKTKLIAMAMSGYDRIIVEPSGIFDMDMFFDSLREEPLENWYEIGSVITIVNANLVEKMTKEADYILASQASCAGCVVLSRTQLSTPENIENTKKHIANAAEKIHCKKLPATYMEKSWEDFTDKDYEYLMNSGYHIGDYMKVITEGKGEFSSVNFLDIKDEVPVLKEKIKTLFESEEYGKVLRVKGFSSENGKNYEISATENELVVKPMNVGRGVVIVIGSGLDSKKIKELLDS